MKVTNLMYAVNMLHIPLVEVLLKYGPDLEAMDIGSRDLAWYVEHNYWVTNHHVVGMEPLVEEKEPSFELTVSNSNDSASDSEEEDEENEGDGDQLETGDGDEEEETG